MNKVKLPDKPSELLKLAMTDLELVEADPRYVVDMDRFHAPESDGCHVCLAGAVLAKTKKVPILQDLDLELGATLFNKIEAIDSLRRGSFGAAGRILRRRALDLPGYYSGEDLGLLSSTDREEWKLHMCTIIGILEAEGL